MKRSPTKSGYSRNICKNHRFFLVALCETMPIGKPGLLDARNRIYRFIFFSKQKIGKNITFFVTKIFFQKSKSKIFETFWDFSKKMKIFEIFRKKWKFLRFFEKIKIFAKIWFFKLTFRRFFFEKSFFKKIKKKSKISKIQKQKSNKN